MTAGDKFPRGSEWREWDMHIHSPASYHWTGEKFGTDIDRNRALVDEMIVAINDARPVAFGVMDYWTFDGWFALKERLAGGQGPDLKKAVFPGIELRLSAPMKGRLNAHVLFSDQVNDQYLRDFLSRLRVELIDQPLSRNSIIEYARKAGADKLEKAGFDKGKVTTDESEAYRAGCHIVEITKASYVEAIERVPDGLAVGFMPFSTNDGLQSVDWNEHYAYALSLFRSSPIFETRDHDLWAAFCGVETAKNKNWLTNFQAALGNVPRLAVSGSDAHKFRGAADDNNNRGYGDFPSNKKTWIKADPTWRGLLQAIKEPAKRSFVGEEPEKLRRIRNNKTFYIDGLRVQKQEASGLEDAWLDSTDIPLNPDLVAVIGNKGSGKSALADIIALLGNSQQKQHFSFLKPNRFRGKAGEPARQFIGTLNWIAGDPCVMALCDDPSADKVELVRYIPQGRFEALCNDHVSGKSDAFEKELREVIFTHVTKEVRLEALNFDQLIERQENVFRAQTGELRRIMRSVNTDIVTIEDQLDPDLRRNVEEMIRLKEKEIEELTAAKPAEVSQPTEQLTPDQVSASERLSAIEGEISALQTEISSTAEAKQVAVKRQRAVRNVQDRLNLFKQQYEQIEKELAGALSEIGQKLEEFVSFEVNDVAIQAVGKKYIEEDIAHSAVLAEKSQKQSDLLTERATLTLQLNEPQQRYQAYVLELRAWNEALEILEGSPTDPESRKGLETRLDQIKGLPDLLVTKVVERDSLARKIYGVLADQRSARERLFEPLQSLIQGNSLIRDDYKLQFQAKLQGSPESIATHLFSLVMQRSGELRGEDESYGAIKTRFEKYTFELADHVDGFTSDVVSLFNHNVPKSDPPSVGFRPLMRKDTDPAEVYNYLYGLEFLEPKYTLLFQDTQIEQLSPGQRGALLLIFYLLVDKGRNPIVLDQPEENLDNETVVSLLVPVLDEAKKTRQIIMVTHNPNLAVVCDSEQIIHATFDRKNGAKITYVSGSIEDGIINRAVVDILEGTKKAFDNRGNKYYDQR